MAVYSYKKSIIISNSNSSAKKQAWFEFLSSFVSYVICFLYELQFANYVTVELYHRFIYIGLSYAQLLL
ncbi:hypothetical protein HanXRQr2_Chr13g0615401 [Helianthus annuus]|uniref:Uncharacterized protein n=1 Tax=Helianthus annuus TaxID=4232 RepID=A0A9K3HCX2_HELAN|nr:hypothetical protein HanXRQr2_Chr13g0615401 [Helianthus annuus]